MATSKKSISKKKGQDTGSIIIHNLLVRAANRGQSEISDWRNALRHAESVTGSGSRTTLYDLYEDILLDAHLTAVIEKRIMSITNHKLRFVSNGKDIEPVAKVIRSRGFRDLLRNMMMAKMWGISLEELAIDEEGNLKDYSIPRKHLRPRIQHVVREQSAQVGIPYREGIYLNTCVEIGNAHDLGLLLKAVPYVLYKRATWGDWSQYAELFGRPTKIGKYTGYDEATRIALEKALDEAGGALSIVIPEEAKLDFLESKTTSDSGNLYKTLASACDEQLSILMLGNTETTKSSQSSGYAQATTHALQQEQIAEDDRAYILGYLDTEVRRVFKSLGLPMDGGEWQFEAAQENISLKDRVTIDTTLRSNGLPIDDDYFYETYSIPKPTNYEKLKKEKAETPPKDKTKLLDGNETVTMTLADLTNFFGLATPTV